MKSSIYPMAMLFIGIMTKAHAQENMDFQRLSGSYLDQPPTGMIPEIFAP
jgi:hypothetical protein